VEPISIRYIVYDAETAATFYQDVLGFSIVMNPSPGFALLERGALRLLLNAAGGGGAGQAMPDGTEPEPGGWNRFQLRVDDLDVEIERIRELGGQFRNDVVEGMGGRQILLEDPSGNLIELFEQRDRRGG
jgi:predicted enzyme related to lactoylglutathione lyase